MVRLCIPDLFPIGSLSKPVFREDFIYQASFFGASRIGSPSLHSFTSHLRRYYEPKHLYIFRDQRAKRVSQNFVGALLHRLLSFYFSLLLYNVLSRGFHDTYSKSIATVDRSIKLLSI
jgi:hypothetical protein